MSNLSGQALSVSAVARMISRAIQSNLSPLWIRGEVSNLTIQKNRHVYFSLKDENSRLNCAVFKNSSAISSATLLKEGDEVFLNGTISYYQTGGYISVIVKQIEPIGEGLLKRKFDQLKLKLEKEGWFKQEIKKPIPQFPERVGIVTSPTGAAVRDILQVTQRRFQAVDIILFPAAVQGEYATKEIARAIRCANLAKPKVDVLIVGRGGGSIEDLWCFNEEEVARAIIDSEIPIISAVGHEIDYTIADYVADLRAPTPSAAAELVVKDGRQIQTNIQTQLRRMNLILENRLDFLKSKMEYLSTDSLKKHIQLQLAEFSMSLDQTKMRFESSMKMLYQKTSSEFNILKEKMEALSPNAILKRGYSITYLEKADGTSEILRSLKQAKENSILVTLVEDGKIRSTISPHSSH